MQTTGRVHKTVTGKACRSCRRRKVRCDRDGRDTCRACERRLSPCITDSSRLDPPVLEHGLGGSGPELGPASPEALTGDATVLCLEMPVLEGTESQLPVLPCCDMDASEDLSSLFCLSLPRSVVGQGSSSPLSLLSSTGKQWLQDAIGDEALDWDVLSPSLPGLDPADVDLVGPLFNRQYTSLPPKDEARHLLNTYFEVFNPFCPLIDEQDFMLWFEQQYPIQPESSAENWACLNAALALACLLDQDFTSQAWLYWKNAAQSWGAFFTHVPSLVSVQALLTMAIYLMGTFYGNPSKTMVPMATRTLQMLGPVKGSISHQFEMAQMVTRALDIDNALQAGMPPTGLGLDDSYHTIRTSLVEELNSPLFDCYESFHRLIGLKEDVYRELYSLSAQDKDDTEIMSRVGQLDARLEQWKSSIPDEFRPGHPSATDTLKRGNCVLIVYLHLSYHNCLLTIHRRTIPCTTWSMHVDPVLSPDFTIRSPNPRTLVSAELCAEAARASMRLVKYIPSDNALIRGVMVYYVVFALKLFVILIVQDPRSPRAYADIMLLRNIEDLLSAIPLSKGDQSVPKLIEYVARYRQVAEEAVKQVLIQIQHNANLQAERTSSIS